MIFLFMILKFLSYCRRHIVASLLTFHESEKPLSFSSFSLSAGLFAELKHLVPDRLVFQRNIIFHLSEGGSRKQQIQEGNSETPSYVEEQLLPPDGGAPPSGWWSSSPQMVELLPPDGGAPPPISKAEPSPPLKETHFSRLYPRPHSLGQNPDL